MHPTLRIIGVLCAELAGLASLASLLILVAAFHRFGNLGSVPAGEALVFCVVAILTATLALIAYACVRVSRLMVENGRLRNAATRDGLTRLLNRTAFKREAERAIATLGRRRLDTAYTLLVIDADHFKRINDRLGHGVGDRALIAIASALAGGLRHDDLVGRLGGEEFAVLLKDAGPNEALIVAERLRAMVNRLAVGPASQPARLAISLGAWSFDRPVPFDLAYRQADLALYRAKKNGRNRVELAPPIGGGASARGRSPRPASSRVTSWDAPAREGVLRRR